MKEWTKTQPTETIHRKREDLKKFLQDACLYLYMNDKTYDIDVKKFFFNLSFINNGDTALWKEQLLEDTNGEIHLWFRNWDEFQKNLKAAFEQMMHPLMHSRKWRVCEWEAIQSKSIMLNSR